MPAGPRPPMRATPRPGPKEEIRPEVPKATSPRAELTSTLARWKAALIAWAAALDAYGDEVGESGTRAIGARWRTARGDAHDAREALENVRLPEEGGDTATTAAAAAVAAAAMAASDLFEAEHLRLGAAMREMLDPNVQAVSASGMSHTFSENIGRLARSARDAAGSAQAAQKEALQVASLMGPGAVDGITVGEIDGIFGRQRPRGAFATEMLMSVLLCAGTEEAARILNGARDLALGCPPAFETVTVTADTEALSEYHPLQAMMYAPAPPSPEPAPGGARLDVSLPQARLAVEYDLAPLIDKRRAAEFGPIAPSTSGLNYKLVERLRTIRVAPTGPRPEGAPLSRPLPVQEGRLGVISEGREFSLAPACFPGPGSKGGVRWAPLAGALPRVGAYSAETESVILDLVRQEREAGWDLDLRPRYEKAVETGEVSVGACNPDVLVDALVGAFEQRLSEPLPETAEAFRDLVASGSSAPPEMSWPPCRAWGPRPFRAGSVPPSRPPSPGCRTPSSSARRGSRRPSSHRTPTGSCSRGSVRGSPRTQSSLSCPPRDARMHCCVHSGASPPPQSGTSPSTVRHQP